jgi:hypothetical protein
MRSGEDAFGSFLTAGRNPRALLRSAPRGGDFKSIIEAN